MHYRCYLYVIDQINPTGLTPQNSAYDQVDVEAKKKKKK